MFSGLFNLLDIEQVVSREIYDAVWNYFHCRL